MKKKMISSSGQVQIIFSQQLSDSPLTLILKPPELTGGFIVLSLICYLSFPGLDFNSSPSKTLFMKISIK
jgi:hypothetical protein